jgi:hypothetical protein
LPQAGSEPRLIQPRTATQSKVKELLVSGKTAVHISEILGISKTIAYRHVKNLVKSGQVDKNEIKYNQAKPLEEQKWYRVIERTDKELPFYRRQGLVPTARKMYYRLIELGVLKKSNTNYKTFVSKAAEARRGVDSTYTKPTNLPRLPIDWFS